MGTHVSNPGSSPLFTPKGKLLFGSLVPLLAGLLLAACGGSAGRVSSQSGIPGQEVMLPGGAGSTFFVDPNNNGETQSLRIVEMLFGRLVDIHDIDGTGATNPTPIFQDYLVEVDLLGSADYRLEQNPLTGRERLVILAERAVDSAGFDTRLRAASDNLIEVVTRGDDGLDPGPFSVIPRNCSLSIRFTDMLADGAAETAALADNVKLLVGNLPSQPYFARTLFDPNHGALFQGAFHSTRVIVDLAVSDAEAAASGGSLLANTVGLPVGDSTADPNVSVRIPTRTVAAGSPSIQLTLLRAVSGVPLDFGNNGPVRVNATLDVVRAFRPGNPAQADNGFLPDITPPEILGAWDMTVGAATNDSAGTAGLDFLLDMQFDTACRSSMEVGDLIELGSDMLLVTAPATPDMAGAITGLAVRSLSSVANPASLVGTGFFVSPLDLSLTGLDGCWVGFSPAPSAAITGTGPVLGVSTTANLSLRFSEPMDPVSLSLLDRTVLVAGDQTVEPTAYNRVAGSYVSNTGLTEFTVQHPLPFAHVNGTQETFTLRMDFYKLQDAFATSTTTTLPTDLAGNAIASLLPDTEFSIESTDPGNLSDSLILRFDRTYQQDDTAGSSTRGFSGVNEVDDPNSTSGGQIKVDFSGASSPDLARGELRGRAPMFQSFVIDSTQPSIVPMVSLNMDTGVRAPVIGVAEPLNRLGAKTMALWRYFDMGMFANQKSTLDVDVVGLNWAPTNGVVNRDFYPEFEIRLGSSMKIPEESYTFNPPAPAVLDFGDSGLEIGLGFSGNVLGGAAGLKTVHERAKGYTIRAIDRFNATTGTPMVPYPLNQNLAAGEPLNSYTWRDSGNLNASSIALSDVPTPTEVATYSGSLPPANKESETLGGINGSASDVQAAVLPLLMEFNCYATANAIGTNRFTIGLMAPGVDNVTFKPYSRLYSAGGINSLGFPQTVNPDTANIPVGGFNPGFGGAATSPGDNVYYLGQLDTVFRVTRLVSHWMDLIGSSLTGEVQFAAPIVEPASNDQPLGTSIQLAFRAATGFSGTKVRAYDPAFQGPNGDPVDHLANGSMHGINFQAENTTNNTVDGSIWTSDITEMKSRFLQVRITFINNIDSGTSPFISALGLPFEL